MGETTAVAKRAQAGVWPASEAEMMRSLRGFLEGSRSMRVFSEVVWTAGEAVADMVGVSVASGEPKAVVFEGKLSMSATLLRQAVWWQQWADAVYLVLPRAKTAAHVEKRAKYWPMLERLGLGLVELHRTDTGKEVVRVVMTAATDETGRGAELLSRLDPALADVADAGSAGGARGSEWGRLRLGLIDAAREAPGTPLKYLIATVDHGYASNQAARSAVSRIARKSGVAGLRFEGDEMKVFADDS